MPVRKDSEEQNMTAKRARPQREKGKAGAASLRQLYAETEDWFGGGTGHPHALDTDWAKSPPKKSRKSTTKSSSKPSTGGPDTTQLKPTKKLPAVAIPELPEPNSSRPSSSTYAITPKTAFDYGISQDDWFEIIEKPQPVSSTSAAASTSALPMSQAPTARPETIFTSLFRDEDDGSSVNWDIEDDPGSDYDSDRLLSDGEVSSEGEEEEPMDAFATQIALQGVDREDAAWEDEENHEIYSADGAKFYFKITREQVASWEQKLNDRRGRELDQSEDYTRAEVVDSLTELYRLANASERPHHAKYSILKERHTAVLRRISTTYGERRSGWDRLIESTFTVEDRFALLVAGSTDSELDMLAADTPPSASWYESAGQVVPAISDNRWGAYTLAFLRDMGRPIVYEGVATNCGSVKQSDPTFGMALRNRTHESNIDNGSNNFYYNCARKYGGEHTSHLNWAVDFGDGIQLKRSAILWALRIASKFDVESVRHDWLDSYIKPSPNDWWPHRAHQGANTHSPTVEGVHGLPFYTFAEKRKRAAELQAWRLANETEEERILRRRRNAEATRTRRATETEEERTLRYRRNAQARRTRRATEPLPKRIKRLAKRSIVEKARIERMDPDTKAAHTSRRSKHDFEWRNGLPQERQDEIQTKHSAAAKRRRDNWTPEERAAQNATRNQKRREKRIREGLPIKGPYKPRPGRNAIVGKPNTYVPKSKQAKKA